MINFLVHWSTYPILFFRKGTLTVYVLKPCTLKIVFLPPSHVKANVSGARTLGTQCLCLKIASKKKKKREGNLYCCYVASVPLFSSSVYFLKKSSNAGWIVFHYNKHFP